jgi:protein-arginine deiminase (PAD)
MSEETFQVSTPISATPEVLTPVVMELPSAVAVFRVTPTLHGQATTAPEHKAIRPGVVLLPTLETRNDGLLTRFAELSLVRPEVLPGQRSIKLEIHAQVTATLHVRQTRRESTLYWRLPLLDQPEPESPIEDDTFDDLEYLISEYEAQSCDFTLERAPTPERGIALRISRRCLPGFFAKSFAREPVKAPTVPYRGGLPEPRIPNLYDLFSYREIWLRLNHGGEDGVVAEDVALFTLAPVLFGSDVDTPLRLYAVGQLDSGEPGNFGMIGELNQIASELAVPCTLLPQCRQDVWAQDAVHLGYVTGPEETIHLVVQTPRIQGLEKVIEQYLPDDNTGLCRHLFAAREEEEENFLDYGGNMVVTPPVAGGSDFLAAGEAGPAVPAHPAAPYGKILLGDGGAGSRRPWEPHWRFFQAQQVQPVVPIDTSWLHVGHVDEIVAFVPAANECNVTHCGGGGFAMLLAWPDLFVQILLGTRAEYDTDKARVPRGFRKGATSFQPFAEDDTLAGYTLEEDNQAQPLSRVAHTWTTKLDAIRFRLLAVLGLNEDERDVLNVPVLLSPANHYCKSRTPDMVNLVALGTTLVIPKPWGPRVPVDIARTILTGLPGAGITAEMVDHANLAAHTEERLWANPEMEHKAVLDAFQNDGVEEIRVIAEPEAEKVPGWAALPDGWDGAVPEGWRLYWIRQTTVDIFEAYMRVRLQKMGLTVHFLDDRLYHNGGGDLHCGTKVRRAPRDVGAENVWWRTDAYHTIAAAWE